MKRRIVSPTQRLLFNDAEVRTQFHIAQDLVSTIALCKMFIKCDNHECSDKQALKYLKLLDNSKKLTQYLGIEYNDVTTPLVVLDSISDYFKSIFKCHQAVIDYKQIDFKCFERFQVLVKEFILVSSNIQE